MKTVLLIMTGIGFFLGVVFGLLLQLPIDNTLLADVPQRHDYPLFNPASFRSRRSLSKMEDNVLQDKTQPIQTTSDTIASQELSLLKPATDNNYFQANKQNLDALESTPYIWSEENDLQANKGHIYILMEALRQPTKMTKESKSDKQHYFNKLPVDYKTSFHNDKINISFDSGSSQQSESSKALHRPILDNNSKASIIVSVRLNLQKGQNVSNENAGNRKYRNSNSPNDSSYLKSIVNGILWTPQLEKSCPKPFQLDEAEAWRQRVDGLDVVKITEGCGRMQNRLITFRDASKACARYRLNTDQIQGEIFSYYLSRIFNMSNIPPTVLARVETLSSKWRTVHLQLSLAQWAESKLVVLTQHIDGLLPAHIPAEFKEDGKRLEPTIEDLGSKTHPQLCELLQWSDLIVFDYLTANLDRVINNMFNSQWNDQMMSSPAHNLEQQADGSLVFLDNESGLFHGYRLLEKYATFHQTLLHSLCVFRQSTAETIKRLHESLSVGAELQNIFATSEVLHKHLAAIPDKNIKILQQRIDDVYRQILHCDSAFNR